MSLACGQQLKVASGISASVAVDPLQLEFVGGGGGHFGHAVRLQLVGGTDKVDRPAPQVKPDDSLVR